MSELGLRDYTPITENQMKKKGEDEVDTVDYRDKKGVSLLMANVILGSRFRFMSSGIISLQPKPHTLNLNPKP